MPPPKHHERARAGVGRPPLLPRGRRGGAGPRRGVARVPRAGRRRPRRTRVRGRRSGATARVAGAARHAGLLADQRPVLAGVGHHGAAQRANPRRRPAGVQELPRPQQDLPGEPPVRRRRGTPPERNMPLGFPPLRARTHTVRAMLARPMDRTTSCSSSPTTGARPRRARWTAWRA